MIRSFALVFSLTLASLQHGHAGYTMSQVSQLKQMYWSEVSKDGGALAQETTHSRNSSFNNPQSCVAGSVTVDGEDFPCDSVDFLSFLSLKDLDITSARFPTGSTQASDIWGWQSPTGREITIECLDNGVVLIDSTDPLNPIILAKIETGKLAAAWCDVKVFRDVLYIVKDQSSGDFAAGQSTYGIEVFNLTRIVGFESRLDLPLNLAVDFVYANHGRSHNIAINPDTGFLYSVGTSTCAGGLHMLNLNNNPLVPEFAGCASSDGYTHDVQCVVYAGPDTDYTGSEICLAFNEDTLTIWDVTVKTAPVILSRTCYTDATYTHQGWITDDFRYVLLDDELDETCSSGCLVTTSRTHTTTYYFDITDLDNPVPTGLFDHGTRSVDHNLYVWGSVLKRGWTGSDPVVDHPSVSYAYLANYVSGLRILDVTRLDDRKMGQAGFFDVSPTIDGFAFLGAWSTFMHPSGVIAVSTIERGVFFLNFTNAYVEPNLPDVAAFEGDLTNCQGPPMDMLPIYITGGVAVSIIVIAIAYYFVQLEPAQRKPPAVLDGTAKL